jgi:hypothetical protein
MAYINTSPGSADEVVLTLTTDAAAGDLVVSGMTDITVSNANDIFTWSQMDESAKLQIPTTATNNISGNFVVDEDVMNGDGTSPAGSAALLGLSGLSKTKVETNFTINVGSKTWSGVGYVTQLALSSAAETPTWQSPITLAVSGEYTIT